MSASTPKRAMTFSRARSFWSVRRLSDHPNFAHARTRAESRRKVREENDAHKRGATTMANYAPFGGFDLYGDMSQQQQQSQGHHGQQNQQQNSPCYEGYNPNVAQAPAPYAFNPSAVNNVGTAPAPPFMPPFGSGLDHLPVSSNHVSQHHHHSRVTSHNNKNSNRAVPNMSHSTTFHAHATPMITYSTIFDDPQLDPIDTISSSQQADPAKPASADKWLDTISITVSGVSLEPLSGSQVLKRVRKQTDKVVTCYLPCVEFLVNCQQELRAGLATATQKKLVRHAYRDAMTPRQFYNRYLAPLTDRFHRRNKHLMEAEVLDKATQEIASLCKDAQKVQNQGCEAMKNAFLGGMKDGESWGLRKWLSRNGGALHICNDIECILNACQKLERGEETTVKLAERLRPLAKQAHTRLKSDVPASYQEISTAHPYLPFFHRLESALKGMSNFDPEDDDVICIDDDDEIEEVKAKAVAKKPEAKNKRSAVLESDRVEPFAKRARTSFEPVEFGDFGRDGTPPIKNPFDSDGDDDSVIEILGVKPPPGSDNSSLLNIGIENNDHWRCSRCSMLNVVCSNNCCMCGKNRQEEQTCPAQEADNDMLDTFSELAGLASFEDAASSVAAKIFDLPDPSTQRASSSQMNHSAVAAAPADVEQQFAPPVRNARPTMTSNEMIQHLEHLAYLFEINKQGLVRPRTVESDGFWDVSGDRYARVLRLFVSLIRNVDCEPFLHPVDQHQMNTCYVLYSNYIKNPLCFQDIVYSLVDLDRAHNKSDGTHQPCGTGILPGRGLARWNMWRGLDLLQAIDLVFLNSLAFHGKERTRERSSTNRVRKLLWDEIHRITVEYFGPGADEARRKATPTRRGETSGFVVRKT